MFEKYSSHGWLINHTYNSLVNAFGERYKEFSFKELASFTSSLARVGLRQTDIVREVVSVMERGGTRAEAETD